MRLLMIDNYDSFTYNIVQYFGELGQDVRVFRNDAITLDEIARLNPDYLVISPGPCAPARPAFRWPRSRNSPARFRCSASALATSPSAKPSAARSCTPSS
jgi:anthranilate/para-aminobenzoate synthase component II